MKNQGEDITELLEAWSRGEEGAEQVVLEAVYSELRKLAIGHLRTERTGHTLEPSALIHEAYMRLAEQSKTAWRNRHHFFGIASRMMGRVLTDYARRRTRAKRGGGWVRVQLDSVGAGGEGATFDIGELDAAIAELRGLDERKASIVELRFFGGLTIDEAAAFLGCSPATVRREWTLTKAWMVDRLG